MRQKRYNVWVTTGYAFPEFVLREWNIPDLAGCPDDNGGIRWREGKGGVGSHWGGDGTKVVGQTIPDVVQGTRFQIPRLGNI